MTLSGTFGASAGSGRATANSDGNLGGRDQLQQGWALLRRGHKVTSRTGLIKQH